MKNIPWVKILSGVAVVLFVLIAFNFFQSFFEKKRNNAMLTEMIQQEEAKEAVQKQVPVAKPQALSAPVAQRQSEQIKKPPVVMKIDESAKAKTKIFTIQIASVKDQAGAQGIADKAKKEGLDAEVAVKDVEGKGTWYRVCVGNFATKAEAQAKLPELQAKFKDSFVNVLYK